MILKHDPDLVLALRGVLVGAIGLLLIAVLPADSSGIGQIGMLLALWLCIGSILVYAARHRTRSRPFTVPLLPLRFSGPTGRFTLRKRGDGRHVEIVAEDVVLAEVKASDLGDEIAFRDVVASDEIEDLGSALGQAIDLVVDADEAHLDWDDHAAPEEREPDQPASTRW